MKLFSLTLFSAMVATTTTTTTAFQLLSPATSSSSWQQSVGSSSTTPPPLTTSTALFGYVPQGFTPESWKKFQQEEEAKKKQKSLGRLGPRGFQSRSMQSFQEALERGEAEHLMPVFNAKEQIKSGKIRPEDVPYMQRGGKWDNTDIKGAKNRKKWLSSDKEYAAGGYKKEQSVSIFGIGTGLDWTGSEGRTGPVSPAGKFSKNYKPPNVKDFKNNNSNNNNDDKPPKKGLFGLW